MTDEETSALEREIRNIVDYDRYQFSPRIRTLRGILNKIRPPALIPEPPAPTKHYEPPRAGRRR